MPDWDESRNDKVGLRFVLQVRRKPTYGQPATLDLTAARAVSYFGVSCYGVVDRYPY